jgi:hypothetical protein
MKLCAITAAHNLYFEDTETSKLEYAEKLDIYIDYKSYND